MGNGSPWSAPGQAELLARVQATDAEGLRTTARVLGRVAGEYDRVAGEMNGVRAAASNYWQADSQKAVDSYATVLTGDLSDAAAAMRAMADALVAHAEATEGAQSRLRAASGLANAGKYASNQTANDNTEQRWALQATDDFHASEMSVRAKLWQLGTDAPGGIPLPARPPEPKLNWWQSLLSQSPYGPQFWVDSRGLPRLGNPRAFDPKDPLFGFDEDGHEVPAYMADPMAQLQQQDGIGFTEVFEALGIETGVAATEAEGVSLFARVVKDSDGFEPAHINEHIRQFFNLPGRGAKNPPPPPEWATQEFLRTIAEGSVRANRVFESSLKTDIPDVRAPTNAILVNDDSTRQLLLVQFWADGKLARQFATAFRPTAYQLKKALEAKSIVS